MLPPPPRAGAAATDRPAAAETAAARRHPPSARWRNDRSIVAILAAASAILLAPLVWALAATPWIDATWRTERGALELVASPLPALKPRVGDRLFAFGGPAAADIDAGPLALPTSPRWVIDDAKRARQTAAQRRLAGALVEGAVVLRFEDGATVALRAQPRGLRGLGALFWLTTAIAASLLVVGGTAFALRPGRRNGLYLAMALTQAVNLLLIGAESLPGLGPPPFLAHHGLLARAVADLATAAIALHLATLPPLRVPHGHLIAAAGWIAVAALALALADGHLVGSWWWLQGAAFGSAAATLWVCGRAYRIEPNPFALLSRRVTAVAGGTLALLSVAVIAADRAGGLAQDVTAIGPVIWYLFFACLLLLLPFVSSAGLLMREFAVFTGISTVAMSLDLLFVALLAMEPFASLSLAIFLALALYAAARRWLPDPAGDHPALGVGRLFEQLYRRVRAIEDRPQDWPTLLPELLRELFEPLEVQAVSPHAGAARVLGDGAALLVPGPGTAAWLLRFAGRGRRIFTRDDARLADGVVEQVRRALAQDHAVERGRSEERARIAQDLHDDIGARLLTLMYKAPSPDIEDYIRHTLKDLKTLTRGLAASEHRLSFAAAEWKADIAQRLGAAQIELEWSLRYDRDLELGVVQWSALTRVLRELVSNVIQHSAATHVDISASLEGGRFRLRIADDGIGRNPQAWAHGLGLGGVRKRVKQLGGDVHWAENGPAGIACTVIVPQLHEAPH
jgi:signal transduction histidine kinase